MTDVTPSEHGSSAAAACKPMRDPRIDPRKGDEVTGRTGTVRKVIEVWQHSGGWTLVNYRPHRNGVAFKRRNDELVEWRRWCAANVLESGSKASAVSEPVNPKGDE